MAKLPEVRIIDLEDDTCENAPKAIQADRYDEYRYGEVDREGKRCVYERFHFGIFE